MAATIARSRWRTALKFTGAVALGGTIGVAGGVAYKFGPETIPRLINVYSEAIPAFFDYKALQFVQAVAPEKAGVWTSAKEFDELHAKWAPRMLALAFSLRGFFLKGAQLVASNYGNAFPRVWTKAMEPALDNQPHMSSEEALAIVEADLGRPIDDVFSSIERVPMAAASIGQVHRATLREDGRRVVVKVMYPGVERVFRGDVAITKAFYTVAMPEHAGVMDEIERQFANEFDYTVEAAHLKRVRDNLAASGDFKDIVVPAPVLPLCTKRVLVMDEVVGAIKLTTALEDDFKAIASARGVTMEALFEEEKALNAAALARGEIRNGPSAAEMKRIIDTIQWRNWWGRWVGAKPMHVPLNHAALIDELIRVHGHEIFVDGYFNGDPHPGNLLVIRGPDGAFQKLALIDYGQVKELTKDQRVLAAAVIVALARGDSENPRHRAAIASIARRAGLKTACNNPDVMFKLTQISFDRDDALSLGGKNVMEVMEDLDKKDRTVAMADDYVLVVRASLMLRGLGHMLNQHRSTAKSWEPLAVKVLTDAGLNPDDIMPQPVRSVNLQLPSAAAPAAATALA